MSRKNPNVGSPATAMSREKATVNSMVSPARYHESAAGVEVTRTERTSGTVDAATRFTVVAGVAPVPNPAGRSPKPIVTLSPSSPSLSSVAVRVKVWLVWDTPKRRFAGIPE